MSFDDDYKKPDASGLKKVSSKKSMFDSLPKKPSFEEFEKNASEANNKINNYNQQMVKLATKFRSIMEDKTLLANKSIITKSIEKECLKDLIEIAQEINNDENEPMCQGSNGLLALTFNMLLYLKDRANYLEFHLSETINKNNLLTNKVQELEVNLLEKKTEK